MGLSFLSFEPQNLRLARVIGNRTLLDKLNTRVKEVRRLIKVKLALKIKWMLMGAVPDTPNECSRYPDKKFLIPRRSVPDTRNASTLMIVIHSLVIQQRATLLRVPDTPMIFS
jgi:hypothetical protein